jgi:outer membrane protein assembly factor BamE
MKNPFTSKIMPQYWSKIIVVSLCLVMGACSSLKDNRFLKPHKISIQQGNVITQEMVDRLKPGMSRSQVKFVLGTPLVVDTLNNDQWHYIYSLRLGNGKLLQKNFIVSFVDNQLSELTGDYKPSEPE